MDKNQPLDELKLSKFPKCAQRIARKIGEMPPEEAMFLSDDPPTQKEIEYARRFEPLAEQLISKYS